MSNFQEVAQQFTQFYYNTFDADRAKLAGLYRENSMLTFEVDAIQGAQAISEKLNSLPFSKIKHQVTTLDSQPSSPNNGILVMITGMLLVDEEERPMNYVQSFQLLQDEQGQYFVFNDIFRLVYGAS